MGSSKFIIHEIQMYYVVSVGYNGTIVRLTRRAVYPVQWMGLICSEEHGNIRSECEED
jgi:hypothetical protein